MLISPNVGLLAGASPSDFIILMDLFDPGGRNQAKKIIGLRRLGYYLINPSGSNETFNILERLKNIIFDYDLDTHSHHHSLALTPEEIISFVECVFYITKLPSLVRMSRAHTILRSKSERSGAENKGCVDGTIVDTVSLNLGHKPLRTKGDLKINGACPV